MTTAIVTAIVSAIVVATVGGFGYMATKHFRVYNNILSKLIVGITMLAVLVLAYAFGILTGTKVVIKDTGIQPSALVLAVQTDQVDVIVSTLFAFVGAMVVLGLLYWIGARIPKDRSDPT